MNPHQRITYEALKQNGFQQGATVAAIIAASLCARKFHKTFRKKWSNRAGEKLPVKSSDRLVSAKSLMHNLWNSGARSIRSSVSIMDKLTLAKTIAARSAWFITVASILIDALDLASDAIKYQTSTVGLLPFALAKGEWDTTVANWTSTTLTKAELGALIIIAWDCGEHRRAQSLCQLYDGLDDGQTLSVTIPTLITIQGNDGKTLIDHVMAVYAEDVSENDLAIDCAVAFLPLTRSVKAGRTAVKLLKSIIISL